MPPWMWTAGGLCLGALGYAAFTTHLIILFPLMLVAWKFFGVVAEQRDVRKKLEAAEAKIQALAEAELDRVIGGPDAELEAKFKALEIATGVPVALDDPPEVDGMTMIGTGLTQRVQDAARILHAPSKTAHSEERPLQETVRKVVLRGNIYCSLRRRPGKRVLLVLGTMEERHSLQTHLANEILHVTFANDDPHATVQVEICSAALNTIDIQGGEAHISGDFDDLALTTAKAEVGLKGTTKGFYLTSSESFVSAEQFDTRTTHLCCQSTNLHLRSSIITGVLLDKRVTLKAHGYKPQVNVQGDFASFRVA